MTIETIHEHSVDTSLLPDGANILDIGCRGFLFCGHFDDLGHNVVAVDADDGLQNRGKYINCAISDFDGKVFLIRNSDAQATSISKKCPNEVATVIDCFKLETFSNGLSISFWDLIKIDVEGSEYEIIMSLEKAPAKQLSIEFHLHTGIYGFEEITMMENKLLALGYFPVKHDISEQHGAGKNYWDSLWILK